MDENRKKLEARHSEAEFLYSRLSVVVWKKKEEGEATKEMEANIGELGWISLRIHVCIYIYIYLYECGLANERAS